MLDLKQSQIIYLQSINLNIGDRLQRRGTTCQKQAKKKLKYHNDIDTIR